MASPPPEIATALQTIQHLLSGSSDGVVDLPGAEATAVWDELLRYASEIKAEGASQQSSASSNSSSNEQVTASAIYQLYPLSHPPSQLPLVRSSTGALVRPRKPSYPEAIYRRLSALPTKEQFVLTPLGLEHVEKLNRWMNSPRVSKFWMEDGPVSATQKFVEGRLADPHTLAVIGSFVTPADGVEPSREEVTVGEAVYAEIYWAAEDVLGKLYEAQDYDRGIHMLVGEESHRGRRKVRQWLPSLAHYCFLSDPRTQRVVSEPNRINEKMVSYLEEVGFEKKGEVTFPHKTSALMVLEREKFFELLPKLAVALDEPKAN